MLEKGLGEEKARAEWACWLLKGLYQHMTPRVLGADA